jgi:hypothetical protein
VAEAVPGTEVTLNPSAPPDKRSYRVDFSLYRRLAPNHQPQRTLTDAIAELRDNLVAMGFRDADFRTSQLMRLKVLNALRENGQLNDDLEWKRSRSAIEADTVVTDAAMTNAAATELQAEPA